MSRERRFASNLDQRIFSAHIDRNFFESTVLQYEEITITHAHFATIGFFNAGKELRGNQLIINIYHMTEFAMIDNWVVVHEIT